MFTEASFGENIGGIKVDSSVIDLDLDIEKLSDADLLSAFESIYVDDCYEQMDDVAPNINDDAFNPVGLVDFSRQQLDEGKYTCKFDSSDLATIAEPSPQGDGEAEFLVDTDKTCRNSSLIVYTSSRRSI